MKVTIYFCLPPSRQQVKKHQENIAKAAPEQTLPATPAKVFDTLIAPVIEDLVKGLAVETGQQRLGEAGLELSTVVIQRLLERARSTPDGRISLSVAGTGHLKRLITAWLKQQRAEPK